MTFPATHHSARHLANLSRLSAGLLLAYASIGSAAPCDTICRLPPDTAQDHGTDQPAGTEDSAYHLLTCKDKRGTAETHVVVGLPTTDTSAGGTTTLNATELSREGEQQLTMTTPPAGCTIEYLSPSDAQSIAGRHVL